MCTCTYIFDGGVFECLVQAKFGTILLFVLTTTLTTVGQNVIFAVQFYHEVEKQHRRATQAILKVISNAVTHLLTRNTRRQKKRSMLKREKLQRTELQPVCQHRKTRRESTKCSLQLWWITWSSGDLPINEQLRPIRSLRKW